MRSFSWRRVGAAAGLLPVLGLSAYYAYFRHGVQRATAAFSEENVEPLVFVAPFVLCIAIFRAPRS
jgi:hypothetical protein